MDTIGIQYYFSFKNNEKNVFSFSLDAQKLSLVDRPSQHLPDWTRLEFHQCSHCPLKKKDHPHCPVAVCLSDVLEQFESLASYDEIFLEVVTRERRVSQHTTAQKGICSMLGLLIAASGCPHTAFLRPMLRFHLPFASEQETIYRSVSMYMLAQYFLKREGKNVDLELDKLRTFYDNLHLLNFTIVERLRSNTRTDSYINAIIVLDTYTKALPNVIKYSLDEIKYLFLPYLD